MSATMHKLILCGGRARRMDQRDKGLQLHAGKPLIDHVIARMASLEGGELWINCNRNQDQYASRADRVICDQDPTAFNGPLAGMLSGLLQLETEQWLAVAPCDAPAFDAALYTELRRAAIEQEQKIAVAHDDSGYAQPVFCVIHQSATPEIEAALTQKDYKIMRAFDRVGYAKAHFAASQFENINTLEQLID